jgi:hypothetical protein
VRVTVDAGIRIAAEIAWPPQAGYTYDIYAGFKAMAVRVFPLEKN